MVDVNRPSESLSYGTTPYLHDRPVNNIFRRRNVRAKELERVTLTLFVWLEYQTADFNRVFFQNLFEEWSHYPKGRSQLHGFRLLVMTQFFMRHPTFEGYSRGKFFIILLSANFCHSVNFFSNNILCDCCFFFHQVTSGISGLFWMESSTSLTKCLEKMKIKSESTLFASPSTSLKEIGIPLLLLLLPPLLELLD